MRILAPALLATILAFPVAVESQAAREDWKKGAVCYEIFVRSFYDSDGDGIGDLNGLTRKLDYINDGNPRAMGDLGARCIWLMPVAASPSYHGYDVKDYYRVNPEYGTTADFKRFMAAAHKRGIRVLVDLVLNHASNEHPYFKAALRDTTSPYRSWFRFSRTRPDIKGPWGQDVWHKSPVRDEYYYGIFWSGMPDLNYENPAVREEAKRVARYWLTEMGVDGFRLDAVPYLVEVGNVVKDTRETHDILRDFGADVRRIAPRAFTVGEVWDSLSTVLTYYPDQLDAYFAFALSDALLDAVRTGSASKLLAPFMRMQAAQPAHRWSTFQRNHDQTRTVTALGGDTARARLAAELLFTLPGMPFVYYGEEIGMTGDKPDERLRTPMHWTGGHAAGFTTGAPWEPLQPDSSRVMVQAQDRDPRSLLNLYRRLIHLRGSNAALGAGELVPLTTNNDAVLAFLRRDRTSAVLVVANLGTTPISGVTISKVDGLLFGSYAARELLRGGASMALNTSAPLGTLAPMQTYAYQLTQRR